jgi:hypothetical protein
MGRLSITPVFRGHWKGLSNDRGTQTHPDWLTRGFLLVPAVGVAAAAFYLEWTFHAGAALLAGVALLAGASLAVFAQLAALRVRLSERREEAWLDVERDGIDEAVAHLLTAFALCIVNAMLLVIGMNVGVGDTAATSASPEIGPPFFPLIAGISYYTAVLFLLLVSKLYSAYVETNRVRRELDGFDRSHGGWLR